VQDRFAEQVRDVLTTEQQAELDRFSRNIEANLGAAWQVELAAYPAAEVAGTGWGTIGEWAGPLLADAKVFLSRARTLFDGKRLGGSLALPMGFDSALGRAKLLLSPGAMIRRLGVPTYVGIALPQEAFLSRARTVLDRLTAALAALDPSRTPPAPTVATAEPIVLDLSR